MHEDRGFVQVKLPPWLDGPRVRALAKERGVSELEARMTIYEHFNPGKKFSKENRDGQ